MVRARLLPEGEPLDIESLVKELLEDNKDEPIGAVLAFLGVVRGVSSDGAKVKRLLYEAYEEVAVAKMEELLREAVEKHGVVDARAYHYVGERKVGQPTFLVLVASRHRKEGFAALAEIVERVKKEVPIWKKEETDKGSYWLPKL